MDTRRVSHTAEVRGTDHVDLRLWPLIGRDDEMDLATSALETGGSVVLTGTAGVGKTRLAREVLARATTDGDRAEWVTATQSAATIPLGPVAHLIPDASIDGDREATLRAIVGALRRDDDTRLLLGIDDAHLLDDASAALVQLLVTGGTARAVVTVRSGEQAPDAIASLWKDGSAALVALQALSRAEVERVVAHALDGPVDGATLHFFWESSRGNALFLRELVQHGIESGALFRKEGLWRWPGRLELGDRLHNLVEMRIGTLNGVERAALELLAVGQPLTINCLRRLRIAEIVAQMERRSLVAPEPRARGIALAHPLFGEILRERMPTTRRDQVLLELSDAVEATSNRTPGDQFRVALWRLEAGDRSRPEQNRAAAARALRLWEPVIAERLARAALDAGADMEATYVLGASLSDQSRPDEAIAAFRSARSMAGPDRLRAAIAADEAGVLSHQLGRLSDAEQVLRETLERVHDPEALEVLEGGRAAIVVSGGFATTGGIEPSTDTVPTAALAALIENAAAGHLGLAVRIATDQLATAPEWTDDFPKIELYMHLARSWALLLRGDLVDAQARADAGYAEALEVGAEFPRVTWSLLRGMILVAQGRPGSAKRALLEAVGGSEVVDRGFLRPSHAYCAMAAALVGDVAASDAHLRAAHDAQPSYDGLFGVDVARAGAWLSAARGEVSAAAAAALHVAEEAAGRGVYALEVCALHDVVRFGRAGDVAARLEALTTLVDGAWVDSIAAHARAVVDDDGVALDAASDAFALLAFDVYAAEASAAAARAHRRVGKRASAFAALERAHELAGRCESADTPALEWVDQPEDLTPREREITDLACGDRSSREIAERLGITTRTVDNLLGRVYAKLGVSGRQELAEVLGRTQ